MASSPPTPEQHQSQPESQRQFSLTSHDTALALIPPKHLWPRLDRLRALYDKAYPRWPPHINLVYPFVRPDCLDAAVDRVAASLRDDDTITTGNDGSGKAGVEVCLDKVGVFPHKRDNTIYLSDDAGEGRGERGVVARLREAIVEGALGGGKTVGDAGYRMHLTVGQSEDVTGAPHKFLVEKVGLVPALRWTAGEVHVLVRERDREGATRMRLWGVIRLADGKVERVPAGMGEFYGEGGESMGLNGDEESQEGGEDVAEKDQLQSGLPYYFDEETERWVPFKPTELDTDEETPTTLTVASYNVLAEFEWPASVARYPLLVENILARDAAADVLVLQEVTDGFLSFLLADERIRDAYPFCSHGPPDQDDIEPLPSYLNIVVLSKIAFDWEYVSFHRKHKGAIVARFNSLGRLGSAKFYPLVLASVHLSQGLTDGAVAAKKTDIRRIIGYLSETYPSHPWVLAGDFNVTTSTISIDAALKKNAISDLTAGHLARLDTLLTEAKLDDAWKVSLTDADVDSDEEPVEGEQGATWDPTANTVAAATAGSGANMRPQRYDRILVRGEGLLEIVKFNMFGFPKDTAAGNPDLGPPVASDHWGIRCVMNVGEFGDEADGPSEEISSLVVPVHLRKAPQALARGGTVNETLVELGVIPSDEEATKRKAAFKLLKHVLLETPTPDAAETARLQPTVVMVAVGSYALDVWTSSSDMDVMCIGPFSTSTFFALASQRLRKAAGQGIRILRRVRANTGTMLEIEVHDIKMDLQYCPATDVAERWPNVLRTPASDPIWSLSAQTLSKLKAIRDIDYIRRSVPDLAAFRTAHRFIKTWAKSRGIYSARFGFLSGIQISILLARVCKLLARESGPCSVEDILTTFFSHYASFDWATKMAFDPLFHNQRLSYTRTSREPLAILGYFPPALNTALAASVPSVRTLSEEFRRASESLSSASSWSSFLSASAATADFLAFHKTYIKLDIQYWGLSLAKGAQFLGWLESRCVMLLVDLHRRVSSLHMRMWPARFVERAESDTQQQEAEEQAREYRGTYLIGLDKLDSSQTREDLQTTLGALRTALSRFETQMRSDGRYFDTRSCWLSAALVNKAELNKLNLELDSREWGEYTPGDEEQDDEDEEEAQGLQDVSLDDEEESSSARKFKKNKGGKRPIAVVDVRTDKTKKFRTAADVMNRIRWDPQLDSSDYVVGYEDRFTGAQEKELEAWKSEQTDEEFIPQHRILYFRRKSDGKTVWDRRIRWDELFGSAGNDLDD
ncbi:polynucleotide adenylyltransferase [Madurella fahalii]|uniref:polynucleotide adenylyltransferase n=1 Tax=Madurella fahalii TaxID=1157608 RepID=A0ABQ0GM58_9PEZI